MPKIIWKEKSTVRRSKAWIASATGQQRNFKLKHTGLRFHIY